MPSKVYFAKFNDFSNADLVGQKVSELFNRAGFGGIVKKGGLAAVKVHFGEENNAGFVKPDYIARVVSKIKDSGGRPFVAETNTLYHGRRSNTVDHLNLAKEHGFTHQALGAPVVIADGMLGGEFREIKIDKGHFISAKIAPVFAEADNIFCLSHIKCHMLTGIGGCIKNIGMGCASRAGKLAQHSDVAPVIAQDKCTGCGVCVKVCPVDAMALVSPVRGAHSRGLIAASNGVKKKAYLHKDKCIGCGECLIRCRFQAIDIDWNGSYKSVSEKMAEYAYAALKDKNGRCAYISFINHFTKECDCMATGGDPVLLEDIGMLASSDIVAIDKAAVDIVLQAAGEDIFTREHPKTRWQDHIEYAAKLGLGSMEYELTTL